MTEQQIKAAVRERDGYKCRECCMSNFEHVLNTGRSLEVHRLVPGSKYTIEGCVTLCRKCHGPKPKVPRDTSSRWRLDVDFEVFLGVQLAAKKKGLSISEFLNAFFRQQFPNAIALAKKYVQRSK